MEMRFHISYNRSHFGFAGRTGEFSKAYSFRDSLMSLQIEDDDDDSKFS